MMGTGSAFLLFRFGLLMFGCCCFGLEFFERLGLMSRACCVGTCECCLNIYLPGIDDFFQF